MRLRATFVLGFLLGTMLSGVALAATFSITLTSAQQDVVVWKWNKVDPTHAKWATAVLFMQDGIVSTINDWSDQRTISRTSDLKVEYCTNVWPTLTTTQQNTYCTSHGESAGCNPCQ